MGIQRAWQRSALAPPNPQAATFRRQPILICQADLELELDLERWELGEIWDQGVWLCGEEDG